MDKLNTMVGDNIRRRRRELQITQKDLAEKLGLSRPSVVQYEKGYTNIPGPTLIEIARALKCSPSDLINSPADQQRIENKYLAQIKKYQVRESDNDYSDVSEKLTEIIKKLDKLIERTPER